LFIRPEADSALIGYVADDVPLELAGSVEHGRVPVRVDGALRARGYVPEELLRLRVQRRGRVRGTPTYVGPGDRVRVLGSDVSNDRLRVQVTARLGQRDLGTYEGSYPSAGLSARTPDAAAEPPDPGVIHQVPARLQLDLYELPGGARVARLAAQDEPYEVRVVQTQDGWLAVRAGSGPYLIGWTHAALVRSDQPVVGVVAGTSASADTATSASKDTDTGSGTGSQSVPKRLAREPGELRRVAAHSKVVFGEQVIGVFKTEGWARVLAHYPSGFVDVFAAADDGLAIRGLMRTVDLLQQAPTQSEPVATPAAPTSPWMPAAPLDPKAAPTPQPQPPAAPAPSRATTTTLPAPGEPQQSAPVPH